MHLLGGPVAAADAATTDAPLGSDAVAAGEWAALKANQARLEAEVATLRRQMARLAAELGVELD
jgi:uncharacterized protein YceH (UPF0502 family)